MGVVEFKDAPNTDMSRVERESEGRRPSKRRAEDNKNLRVTLPSLLTSHLGRNRNGQPLQSTLTSVYIGHQPSNNSRGNLPPNGMLLSCNAPPFIPNTIQPSSVQIPTHVNSAPTYHSYGGYVSQAHMRNHGPTPSGSTYPLNALPNSYPFYTQPINLLSNAPVYPRYSPMSLFADSTRCVTPFVRWIEDYTLPNGLKMPSHVGSYDGKGDPDNYLHLFEGAILHYIKQRDGESTRAFVTRYRDDTLQILGLHEEQRISGFVYELKTRSLVVFLSTDLPTTYKGLMEKTYTWIEAKEVATIEAPNDH
ncbi:hypothetical protein Tco_0277501 [Tanacetum coccineum]